MNPKGIKRFRQLRVPYKSLESSINAMNVIRIKRKRVMTPLKAIRANCLNCESGSRKAIRNCNTVSCPLFAYRLGHNPARRGIGGGLSNFRRNLSTQVDKLLTKVAL